MSTSTSSKSGAHPAVKTATARVEKLLSKSNAFRKVDDGLYVVKQGSTLVMVTVHPWKSHAIVRLVAQLVKGVRMEAGLALELLELNSILRFGAFAYAAKEAVVLFCHTMADRELTDAEEFMETIRDFAFVADDYDDRIADRYGGQTMRDLLEESVVEQVRNSHDEHPFLK